jgi:4-amino-4-deoxy-L-arabinose transferase-like glycosyltransferase
MICCALAAILATVAAAWHGVARNIRPQQTRWIAGLLAAILLLVGGSALAAYRYNHTSDDNLAAILMRNICGHPAPH